MIRHMRATLLSLLLISLSIAATNVSSCGTLSTPNVQYVLTQSISSNGTCITLNADNITLDCNGSSIIGNGSWYGINSSNAKNVSISNCDISAYNSGIFVNYASGLLVSNATLHNNSYAGLYILGQFNNLTISNIEAFGNRDGVHIFDSINPGGRSRNNSLRNITAYLNLDMGLYIGGMFNSSVSDVSLYDNAGSTYIYVSANNSFSNIVSSNSSITIASSDNNVFSNMSVSNSSTGLYVDECFNNSFYSVNLSGNPYNLRVSGVLPGDCANNFTDSYVDGRPIYSIINAQDLIVPSGAGFIIISDSTNITVENQTFYNNGYPMIVCYSSSVSTRGIVAYNNSVAVYFINSENCSVSGILAYGNGYGINLYGFSRGSVSNVTAYGNSYAGFAVTESSDSSFSNLSIHDNPNAGISMYSLSNSAISAVILHGNGDGFDLESASNNTFSNLSMYDNLYIGFNLYNTAQNSFYNITAINNSDSGIYMESSRGDNFSGVDASRNSYYGISAYTSNDTYLTDVQSSDNGQDGIYIESDNLNMTIANLTSCGNNQSGGEYYDYNDLNSANASGTTCDTSYPEGVCEQPCSPPSNSPPAMDSSTIIPSPEANSSDTLLGYCMATDPDGDDVNYTYLWYLDGGANSSGTTAAYSSGVEAYVGNIGSGLIPGQNWTLECTANDGIENSSGLNSTVTHVQASGIAPAIRSSRISPSPKATLNNDLQGFCNATDLDTAGISYHYVWYLNEAVYKSGTTSAYPQGTELNVDNISRANLSVGQKWELQCRADDGALNSSALNSSETRVAKRPATMTLKIKNNLITRTSLTAVSVDGQSFVFPYPITFAAGESKIVSFDIEESPCDKPGDFVVFENMTIYYDVGAIQNMTQTGSIPLATRCS